MKSAFRDPIVEEIREIKNRLAKKYNYNVRAMLEDVQKRQAQGGRKIIAAPSCIGARHVSVPVGNK